MQKIVIISIVAQKPFGTIVSCRDEAGCPLRAIFPKGLWPVVGEVYGVTGDRQSYQDKYGKIFPQATVKMAVRSQTSGRLIRPWLESLPGIGAIKSKRLHEALGNEVVNYLGDTSMTKRIGEILDPQRPDAGDKLATIVQLHYLAFQAKEKLAVAEGEFLLRLEEAGVSDRQAAVRMFRLIGSTEAYEQLTKHPYMASSLLPWKQADHLGARLLKERPNLHPDRLTGACDSVWRDLLNNGETAATRPEFLAALANKKVNATQALRTGIERRRVIEAGDLLRAPGAVYLESTLARRLVKLDRSRAGIDLPTDVGLLLCAHESPSRPLSEDQRRAVCGILKSKVSILQGGAGTGKTTTLKVLVDCWVSCGGKVMLGALSGKAALRLSRSTGRLAETLARHLHRLDRAEQNVQERGAMELFPKLTTDTMFIIDEASMVDMVTMRKLALAMPEGAKLLLVGDIGQLPPVGLGQGYHDLVETGYNVFQLTQVHRQSGGNSIIEAATAVRDGRVPTAPTYQDKKTGIFHLKTPSERIEASVIELLDQMLLSTPIEDILVFAALKRTCASINRCMQVRRQVAGHDGNWIGPQLKWVSVGEPVICTRNRYEDGLMNGQVGHVNALTPLTVRWDGDEMGKVVPSEVYVDLAPAWAIRCHRAQGSESRHVIIALDGKEMLTREWLYTAITRATEQVILVGPDYQIHQAVNKRSKRTTYFKQELDYWRAN